MSVVPVDFAGNGTNDYAVYLICGEGSGSGGKMVVGYRRTSRGFESLGRIVGTQDGFQMMEHMRRKGNGIEVLLSREFIAEGLQKDIPSQWRTYVLRGNGFQQVGSPVTFTPQPPAIRLTIQARPVVLRRVGTGRTGSVQVTVANSGTEAAVSLDVRLVLPESLQPAGLNWSGCAAAETGTYVCRIATLAAGATVELSYDVLAPDAPSPTRDRYVSAETDSLDSSFNIVASASTPLDFLYA
jgi:hypothetical protein